jgi:cytochrome b subunit of formate dehydrogenase
MARITELMITITFVVLILTGFAISKDVIGSILSKIF